ncbi:MAG: hypothetical protein ABSA17_05160 [Rhabdochlamydiaceae bacterium]|jgi:hypothetical protein
MQKVGLREAVNYGPFVKSLPQTLLEIADNYFGGKKVQVIADYRQGKSEGVIDFDKQISERTTFITRLLYAASTLPLIALAANKTSLKKSVALSLAVPALMLASKIALRSMYPFHHVVEDHTTEFVGESLSMAYLFPTKGKTLEWEKLYLLTSKEMADLRIKPTGKSLLHNLPLTSNEHYSVPPRIHRGKSELSEYEDSVFEYRRYDERYYEVFRKKSGELPLDYDQKTELSRDQMSNLGIISQSLYKGFSIRPEYSNSYFSLECMGDAYYVTRRGLGIPFTPFNEVVFLSQLDYNALALLDHTKIDYEPFPGEKWGIFSSKHDAFAGSCFLVSKFGTEYSVVRMMKPQVEYIDV